MYLYDSLHGLVESDIQPPGNSFVEPDVTLGHLKHLRPLEQFVTQP